MSFSAEQRMESMRAISELPRAKSVTSSVAEPSTELKVQACEPGMRAMLRV